MTNDSVRILKELFEKKGFASSTEPAVQIWIDNEYHMLTYKELHDLSFEGGERLQKMGIRSGDRVVLIAESRRPNWVVALFSIWQAEATAVLIDPSLPESDFQELIHKSDCRTIITSASLHQVVKDRYPVPLLNLDNKLEAFEGSLDVVCGDVPPTSDPDSDVACIIFTSGTTKHPQGVMLTHQNMLFVAEQSIALAKLDCNERILGILPLHHVFGLVNVFLSAMLVEATVTFVEKIRSDQILLALRRGHITTLAATPRILELFYRKIMQSSRESGMVAKMFFDNFSRFSGFIRARGWGNPGPQIFPVIHAVFGGSLRKIISGAAPLSHELFRRFEQIGWNVIEGYGLTETAGIVAANTMETRVAGTVGKPVSGIKIKIDHTDSSGAGEICISGPNVMKGYFRDPQASSEMVRKGWLHTGDLGHYDKYGNLIISGRIKEMIVTASGKKAMPSDIEHRCYGIPGILELVVVGIKSSEHLGDEIHAAIVLDHSIYPENTPAVLEDIKSRLSDKFASVPPHMHIQHLHILDSIPKTATLKIKRNVLRKELENLSKHSVKQKNIDAPEKDLLSLQIKQILMAHVASKGTEHAPQIYPSASLQFDLGLDSLDRTEIANKIESTCRVKLNESMLYSIDKVSDLILLVKNSPKIDIYAQVTHPEEAIVTPKKKGSLNRLYFKLFEWISKILWSSKVEGLQNVPLQGPFILCANHQSYLDAYWIYAYLPPEVRERTCCLARKELVDKNWWTAMLSSPINIIPTDREGDTLPAIKMSLAVLHEGRSLLIFPEGNRSRSGEMRAFHRGAAHLANLAKVCVVPVWINGAYDIYPRHKLMPRLFDWKNRSRYHLEIKFGAPMQIGQQSEEAFTENVRLAVERLRG